MVRSLALSLLVACGPSVTEAPAPVPQEAIAVAAPVAVEEAVVPIVAPDPPAVPIVATSHERVATFALGHGETLDDYARWSGLPVEVIASASGLSLHGGYAVGTAVSVPVEDDASEARLLAAREASNEARVARWVDRHGGTGATTSHTVRTGETAWSIARSEDKMPIWVLAAYNPDTNLDRLKPGQRLLVPELVVEVAPTVAAAPVVVETTEVVTASAQGDDTDSE